MLNRIVLVIVPRFLFSLSLHLELGKFEKEKSRIKA
jgi:hypothetical protein